MNSSSFLSVLIKGATVPLVAYARTVGGVCSIFSLSCHNLAKQLCELHINVYLKSELISGATIVNQATIIPVSLFQLFLFQYVLPSYHCYLSHCLDQNVSKFTNCVQVKL